MLAKLFDGADVGRTIISSLVVVGFFGTVAVLLLHQVAVDSVMGDVLKILTGTLGANFGAVVQYHFGSSAGSKNKDAILAKIAGGNDGKASP